MIAFGYCHDKQAEPYILRNVDGAIYMSTINDVDNYHESDNFIYRELLECGCSKVSFQDDNTDSVFTYIFNHSGIVVEYIAEK